MKNFLMIASFMTATSSFSNSMAVTFDANHFVCSDELNQKQIVYLTTTKTGKAHFKIEDQSVLALTVVRAGDEIQVEKTKHTGSQVTIVAANIPDSGTITKTLVLPVIRLSNEVTEVPFDTMLIETHHKTSFFGSSHLTGNLSESTFTKVSCIATRVES